jgi:DNA topoisomerase-1
MSNRIQKFVKTIIHEYAEGEKWYNPATGNYVGYARAWKLGLIDKGQELPPGGATNNAPAVVNTQPIPKRNSVLNIKTSKIAKKREPQWYDNFKKYKLNAYPVGIPQDEVKVDETGNIDTHAILTWTDPKSGATKHAYTEKFMKANAALKWKRIKKIKAKDIEDIKKTATKLLANKNSKIAESGAVISIIAQTGLRPGQKKGFEKTGNRGVSTLSPDNVTIDGSKITLSFTGKSYQENKATIDDAELAQYLGKLKEQRSGEQFLFDVDNRDLEKVYDNTMGMKDFKLKDLRTWFASEIAIEWLETDTSSPPPIPEQDRKIKPAVKAKLKRLFEYVADKLNNTPTMAKTSYVHPAIIDKFLNVLGVEPKVITNEDVENEKQLELEIQPIAADECEEYLLPEWWFNEEIELVPIKEEVEEASVSPNGELVDFDDENIQLTSLEKFKPFVKKLYEADYEDALNNKKENTGIVSYLASNPNKLYFSTVLPLLKINIIMSVYNASTLDKIYLSSLKELPDGRNVFTFELE